MRLILLVGASACAWLAAPVWAETPEPYSPDACYVKKATWQETLASAFEAMAHREAERNAAEAARLAADPALKRFKPLAVSFDKANRPQAVKLNVAGLKKLYIGASGQAEVYVGEPRVADLLGEGGPLHVGKCPMTGRKWLRHDQQGNWRPRKVGDRLFERGFVLLDTELEVALDGEAEQLECWVACRRTNAKQPARFWIDSRPLLRHSEGRERAREKLWERVRRDFPGQQFETERALERAAGIWDLGWRPGQLAALARRYADACKGKRHKAALELAAKARTEADVQRVRDLFYLPFAQSRLDLAKRTLALVERAAPRPQLAAELQTAETRLAAPDPPGQALYAQLRALRRRIIFSHPKLDFDTLLVNRRPAHVPGHMCDQYLGRHSSPGPGLTVLSSWKSEPKATALLAGKLPPGMTYHPDLSFDATRVVFAFCDHTEKRRELRAFFLYEAAVDGSWVRQITGTPTDERKGTRGRQSVLVEDYDPCYLPDGGIAFISTRSQQFGRCHGSRYVPSYVLYRCDADGSNIRRLSFNEANEWNPSVLHDGRIVYTRWDYINRHDTIYQSLWVMRPDGTATGHFYGNNSRAPCMIAEARAIPGSPKVVATGTNHHGYTAGTILVIDPRVGDDQGPPLLCVTPEFPSPEGGLPRDTAAAPRPLPDDVPAPRRSRMSGRAASPFPITEDIFLVAYPHLDQYAVYLVDTLGGRELVYYDPKASCFNPIPVRPRPRPPALPSFIASSKSHQAGRFAIQDVYRCTQPLARGSIKRLRVNEIISQPTRSKPPLSAVQNEIIKRVLGTVPVNDDGSVAFEAPAATPLQFQLLDENGMAVMTMRSLVYAQPGERVTCSGCHEPRYDTPLQKPLARVVFRTLDPPAGPHYPGGLSFARTVQPVLDRYCITCHGLGKTEGGVNLLGTYDKGPFTASYAALTRRGLVKLAHRNSESVPSRPKDYFANASKLARMLLAGHPDKQGKPRVKLDPDSWQRVVDWLDLNCQFFGDYSFNRAESRRPSRDGEKALRQAIARRFGPELAAQPFAALVNVAMPTQSRILLAPLPESAGGWGQLAKGAFKGTADPAYQQMLALVSASITPLKFHDIAGTCGRGTGDGRRGCACGCCWVRIANEQRAKTTTTKAPAGVPAARAVAARNR